jgi:hypothetical protein
VAAWDSVNIAWQRWTVDELHEGRARPVAFGRYALESTARWKLGRVPKTHRRLAVISARPNLRRGRACF